MAGQFLAERGGFEPPRRLPAYTLSRRAPSATRPPLHQELPYYTRDRRAASRRSAAPAGFRPGNYGPGLTSQLRLRRTDTVAQLPGTLSHVATCLQPAPGVATPSSTLRLAWSPVGGSSNGRTADSDSACLGSNPSPPANPEQNCEPLSGRCLRASLRP